METTMPLQMPDLSQLLNRATAEAHRGNLESSLEAIKRIRETYAIERMPDVSAEVMIAEGICEAYAGRLDAGFDRFRRAALVAHHYGSRPIEQLALSWLAHCEFNRGHPLESVKYIGQAHQDIENARPDARFRISSTIAILTEYAGMTDSAAHWFRIARREASKCGERAMMSSIIYNMAALRVGSLMIELLVEDKELNAAARVSELMFVQSSSNYDAMANVHLQEDVHDLLKAQSLMVSGAYSDAADYFRRVLLMRRNTASVDLARARLSMAWCQFNLRMNCLDFDRLIESLGQFAEDADLAFAHHVISRIYEARGDQNEADWEWQLSRRYLNAYLKVRQSMETGLADLELNTIPSAWNGK
jgi:tetratricopeptide (TPR) repeat protein